MGQKPIIVQVTGVSPMHPSSVESWEDVFWQLSIKPWGSTMNVRLLHVYLLSSLSSISQRSSGSFPAVIQVNERDPAPQWAPELLTKMKKPSLHLAP
jgi:hypothetical protein